ncbi:MAG: hypothetical protein EHM61_09600 [Acidobacteria bacterium]|nr:MAG: hypothetical protein EHM61_09600 [Acidobacteriota bacterium]
MASFPPPRTPVRFGAFEVDLAAGEVRKNGLRVRLQDKSFQILALMLDQPGELITREQLRERLWPSGVFVDFEHGLNIAVNRLRQALGDAADNPRFIETVPRRGYRFIAPVRSELRERPEPAIVTDRSNETATATERLPGTSTSPSGSAIPEDTGWYHRFRRLPSAGRLTIWACLGLIMLAVTVATVVYWDRAPASALGFQERGWVLVAEFENDTSEALFSGTLEHALEEALRSSRFVNVVPRERVADALRLMKRPLDSKLDARLANEVCLRDGGIQAVITGRVAKLDKYWITVNIVNPAKGTTVGSKTVESSVANDAPEVIYRLSDWVRTSLGETGVSNEDRQQRLEKVTSRSLRAVQLYSRAMALGNQDEWAAAEQLLRQATEEDGDFASAYILLAHSMNNQGKPRSNWLPFAERAFQLSGATSDRERYFIRGSYFGFIDDAEQAISAYKTLVSLYPDDYWGVNNLAFSYDGLGWKDEAVPYYARRADLRPTSPEVNYDAARVLAGRGPGFDAARPYYRRASSLRSRGPFYVWMMPIELYPAWEHWFYDRPAAALEVIRNLERQLPNADPDSRQGLKHHAAFAYLTLGRLQDAERVCSTLLEPDAYAVDVRTLAWIAFARNDRDALRRAGKRLAATWPNSNSVILLLKAGLLDEARTMLAKLPAEIARFGFIYGDALLRGAEGELALTQGDRKTAIKLLQECVTRTERTPYSEFLIGSESLASALEAEGNLPGAALVLEQVMARRRASFGSQGAFWLPVPYRLMRVYERLGRQADADRLRAELKTLLSVADPDHQVVQAFRTSTR